MSTISHPSFLLFSILFFVLFAWASFAAEHLVPADVVLVTSAYDGGIHAGDTLTLASGTRGKIKFTGLSGTAGMPVVIRNDPGGNGPAVIDVQGNTGDAGGFFLECRDCIYLELDGSAKWRGAPAGRTYGIKVTTSGPSPSQFVYFNGRSNFCTLRNIEVDGKWPGLGVQGIGIGVNDHWVNQEDEPGRQWREGFLIERNYVHHVEGEGFYIGPNWVDLDGKEPWRMRNIEIRENLVVETGWDGIQLKSAIEGTNRIHHNICKRVGMAQDNSAAQHTGISIYEGMGEIYSNWVEHSGETGISHYLHHMPASEGTKAVAIYNNAVIGAGQTGPQDGRGIASSSGDSCPKVRPMIYNNTVVRPELHGITVGNSEGGAIRDNIIVDAGGTPHFAPSDVTQANNWTGTVAQMNFVDPVASDFHLTAASPARNAGSAAGFPAFDFDDNPRPKEGAADQGAFEFSSTGIVLGPKSLANAARQTPAGQTISLYDIHGRFVRTFYASEISARKMRDITDVKCLSLPDGIYFLVHPSKGIPIKPIIKMGSLYDPLL